MEPKGRVPRFSGVRYVPKTAHLNLLGPHVGVEATTPKRLVKNRTVLVVDDVANAVPHQEARNGQPNQDAHHGHDTHPLLLGIPLVQPGLLNLALDHTSRVEIALGIDIVARAQGARGSVARRGPRRIRAGERVGAPARTK